MARTSYIPSDDNDVRIVQDLHAQLDLYYVGSLEQQSESRHVAPLGHYPDSELFYAVTP